MNLLQVWSGWLFPTAAFVLGSQGKSACEPFKSRLSVPHTFLGLLDISLISFQNQTFWGLLSASQVPKIGVPDVGHKPLTPRGCAFYLWNSFWLWSAALWVGFVRPHLCISYPSWCGPFFHCRGEAVQLVFWSFSFGVGGGEFRIFLHCCLWNLLFFTLCHRNVCVCRIYVCVTYITLVKIFLEWAISINSRCILKWSSTWSSFSWCCWLLLLLSGSVKGIHSLSLVLSSLFWMPKVETPLENIARVEAPVLAMMLHTHSLKAVDMNSSVDLRRRA